MLRPLLCLSLFTCYVSAVAFSAPRTTSCAETGDLLKPPEPTEGPRKPPVELLRRDATTVDLVAPDNTCGYISGLAGAAYYCLSADEKCAFLPGTSSTPGYVACCNTLRCGARVTCIDQVAFSSSSICDNGCVKDTFTLKCTASSAPYCNGITFVGANVRDYFCDSNTVSTWQTASTTYAGESDGRVFSSLTITPSASTTTTDSFAAPSTITSTIPAAGEGGAAASSPGSTSTSAPAGGGSSTPIGPIVGGVVGGVGGIALVGLIVFLIIRHNTKKKNDAANANAGAAPPGYVPPQDPDNSAYAAAAAGKPAPTAQEQAVQGHWAPAPMENQYTSPQMQQGPYQPVHQQQYPPMAEMPGNVYHPQQSSLSPAGYYPANQSPGQTQSHPGSPGQVSQNSGHLSSAYPDNNDMTSPMSNRRSELLGSEAPGTQGTQGPSPIHSPTPTFATMGTVASPAAGGAVVPHTQTTEGRSEMSANMAGGPYPSNLHDGTYEVPGDVSYHG